MNEVMQDLSAPALMNAIEANLFAFFSNLGCGPRFEVHSDPDMLWSLTNSSFPMFNSILRAQLQAESVDAAIETVIERGRTRNVPLMWWIGPTTRPTDLSQYLKAHDFVHVEDGIGMAVDLLALNPPQISPSDLTITQVQDVESLKTWCHIVAVGFEMPGSAERAWLDTFMSIGMSSEVPFRHYLGWWKGEPVATSQLLLAAGVAGIYCVVTLPAARRQGIGAAISHTPLHEAQAMGYRVGILQSSEMAVSVYRRLGFQEYCRIGLYLWATEHPS